MALFNKKLKNDMRSPQATSIKFCVAALFCVVLFRFIYPDFESADPLLDFFWLKARLVRGFLTYIDFFPAIFMSSMTLPFALKVYSSKGDSRFSSTFFDVLRPHLLTGIAGTVIYALLSLVAAMLLDTAGLKMERESRLYKAALERARVFADEEKWVEASGFFAVCDRIWPQNEAISELEERIASGVERLRYSRDSRGGNGPAAWLLPGRYKSLTVAEALSLAKRALREERYYDAHWLANAAEKLAKEGSVEAADASRTASLAWNAIARLEPSEDEELLFSIYRRKREGYEALVSGEWLRAYYLFVSLIKDAPKDPDVQNYLATSEAGLETVAFFFDEMEMAIGNVQSGVVFSLPDDESGGRMVLRFEALTNFEDVSFGKALEAIGFSERNEPVFRMTAQSVKIMPISIAGSWQTVLLLRAVDRENSALRHEPVWTRGGRGAQLLLNIHYEDFLLAAAARDGINSFFLSDLWSAAERLDNKGFVPEVFQTEFLIRIAEVSFFPAAAVLALVIAWNYRAAFRVRYSLFPMFFVLPVVFSLLGILLRSMVRAALIFSLLSWGFVPALIALVLASVFGFALCVFLLAAQRS